LSVRSQLPICFFSGSGSGSGGADRDVRLTAARDRASIPDAIPANGLPIAGASSSSISSSSSSSSSSP
jgi:hypothetical protein